MKDSTVLINLLMLSHLISQHPYDMDVKCTHFTDKASEVQD